jgi:hypothetical protein
VWERYNANPSYMGGVVSWNMNDYLKINGYPNNYWGWGGEDDEMMRRCRTAFGPQFVMVLYVEERESTLPPITTTTTHACSFFFFLDGLSLSLSFSPHLNMNASVFVYLIMCL